MLRDGLEIRPLDADMFLPTDFSFGGPASAAVEMLRVRTQTRVLILVFMVSSPN